MKHNSGMPKWGYKANANFMEGVFMRKRTANARGRTDRGNFVKKYWKAGVCGIAVLAAVLVGSVGMKRHGANTKIVDCHNELFGENVYLFTPEDDPAEVNQILDELYDEQEENQFGKERYAICFMPGVYDEAIEVNVGYYMQIAGLGELPTDTRIPALQCTATWLGDDPNNHNACCNFWRGVENIEIGSNTMWAVSQATFMRRTQIDGALYLHDNYGWCSGGFLADSNTELMTDSGSQQQWLSRNCNWKAWMGANWNMVFVGTEENKAPEGAWPGIPYTEIAQTEKIQEKPFLMYDEEAGYQVYVPGVRMNAVGTSWQNTTEQSGSSETEHTAGMRISIDEFYVAKADTDTAETLNAALADGRHLLLTPGIYALEEPLHVTKADTIVLGMGLATLQPVKGNSCIETADVPGIILAGILFDAGETESENLLVVGMPENSDTQNIQNEQFTRDFITLSDLFFRVGGAETTNPACVKNCITINSDNVIGDNFWVWRADHGDHVAWDENIADTGIIVNGNNVTIYGLMVEHFEKYQTVWNGDAGKVYMYQSEIPYDVPEQSQWMSHSGTKEGYASFYVDENVSEFEAWGLGIYLYNRDAAVTLASAMEVPDKEGVKVHNICTVMLTGYPGMKYIINDRGGSVMQAGERQVICEYESGVKK